MRDDEIWAALRADMERYEPDRAHTLARIEAARRAHHKRGPLLTGLLVAGVIGVASFGGWQFATERGSPVSSGSTVPSTPTVTGAPSLIEKSAPVRPVSPPVSQPTSQPTSQPASPPVSSPVAGLKVEGVLDPSSSQYWAQENVTLTADRPLASLVVTVRVGRGNGAIYAGAWLTLPAEDFTIEKITGKTQLVFRWTLKAGRKVRPGSYIFGAQYNRTPGARNLAADTFSVVAGSVTRRGHF
jgi:hypothetical protein